MFLAIPYVKAGRFKVYVATPINRQRLAYIT